LKGAFGRVFGVTCMKTLRSYALKEVRKDKVLLQDFGLERLFGELNSLMSLDHPFVTKLSFAFQVGLPFFLK